MPERGWCEKEGKTSFPTAADAWSTRRELGRRKHTKSGSVYRCRACGGWHLTSRPKKLNDRLIHLWRRLDKDE